MLKLALFEKVLLQWYGENGRKHLPWRKKNTTPYEVWVSEVMLQQTQVSRVIEYYNRFLQKFPTVFDLAKATWEEFYPYYAGLGYYNRGRNMLQCSQVVVEKHKGKFPSTKEELLALPGIGEYTASAILSFGYNKNELALDTNVKKVLGRVFEGSRFASVDVEVYKKESKAKKKDLNAAIMDFSNSICLKIPRCGECPLQNICEYYATDGKKEESQLKAGPPRAEKHKKQKTIDFDTKKAKVYLFLHANHKEYYSTNKKTYKHFVLSAKINTREKIKKYFREKYKLELSVRPPHQKIFVNGQPVMLVNAQIQTGKHSFFVFKKNDIKKIEF